MTIGWGGYASRLCTALLAAALTTALALAAPASSEAAGPCTKKWDGGGGDSSWGNAANWDLNLVPTAADHACLPAPGEPGAPATAYTVNTAGSITVLELTVGANVTLSVPNSTMRALNEIIVNGKVQIDGTNGNAYLAAGNGDNANAETITNTGTIECVGASGNHRYLSGNVTNQGQINIKVPNCNIDEEGFDADREQTVTNTSTGTITIDAGAGVNVNNKVIQEGTIANAGFLEIMDEFGDTSAGLTVNGGSITGAGTNLVRNNGELAFSGAAASGKVEVQNNVGHSGNVPSGFEIRVNAAQLRSSSSFTNAGKISIDGTNGNAYLAAGNGDNANAETITNTGTIECVGASGNHRYLSGNVTNQGQINIKVPNCNIDEEGFDADREQTVTNTSTGTITIDAGAGVNVNNKVIQEGTIANAGFLEIMDEFGDTSAGLTVNGGSITGAGTNLVRNNGELAFSGAAASGKVEVQNNVGHSGNVPSGFEIRVNAAQLRSSSSFTNAGKISIDGTNGNAYLAAGNGDNANAETITNTGTIECVGASGNHRYLSGNVTNQGQINIKVPNCNIDEEGFDADREQTVTNTSTGTITIDAGAGVNVNNKVIQEGTIANAGFLEIMDEFGDTSAGLTVNGGSITGTSEPRVFNSAELTLSGAPATGAVRTQNFAILAGTIPDAFEVTLGGVTSGSTTVTNNGTLDYEGNGNETQLTIVDGNAATAEGLVNNGEITIKSNAANDYLINGDLDNKGTILIEGERNYVWELGNDNGRVRSMQNAGTLTLAEGAHLESHPNVFTPFANTGTITVGANAALVSRNGLAQTAGSTTAGAGSLVLADEGRLIDVQGGTLTSAGTVGQDLRNAATVIVGSSPGNLKVDDDYTQTAAGTLVMEVGGPTAVTQFDRVQVDDVATLGGTIDVRVANGYEPVHGQLFEAMTANSVGGIFSATKSERVGQFGYVPTYTFNRMNLEARDVQDPETTITDGPEGSTDDRTPTFTFSADEGSTFECRIDGGDFTPCSGPGGSHTPAADLADGEHTFAVWAIDLADNVDRTYARRQFSIGQGGAGGGGGESTEESGNTIADKTGPGLVMGKVKGLKKLKKGAVGKVTVRCLESCEVVAGGTLMGAGKGGTKVAFKGSSAVLGPGGQAKLKVKMTAAGAKRARKAAAAGKKVSAVVVVTASDALDNTTTASKIVKSKGSKGKGKKGKAKGKGKGKGKR